MTDDPAGTELPTGHQAGPAPARRYRSGILHGRRQGRRLRDAPATLLHERLPEYLIDPSGSFEAAALFSVPVGTMRLEIGFGGGEHLAAQAARRPDMGFIGCEPFRNGVASLLQHLDETPCPNVKIHPGDAGEIVDLLPAASLSGVDLLYPDPWPKRRQRKRRFVSGGMLKRLARAMRPGADFRFATDIDDYAGWTLARVLASADFTWDAAVADDWRLPWASWVQTRYEAKAIREGRKPVYLTFRRR